MPCHTSDMAPHPAEPLEGSAAMAITLTLIGAAIGAIVGLMLADFLDRRARRAAIVKRIRAL
jgi:cytosine/uracil/thiamine/allantoin permease